MCSFAVPEGVLAVLDDGEEPHLRDLALSTLITSARSIGSTTLSRSAVKRTGATNKAPLTIGSPPHDQSAGERHHVELEDR